MSTRLQHFKLCDYAVVTNLQSLDVIGLAAEIGATKIVAKLGFLGA
jgi:hypothetical protein